jgi:hypothetical protein
MDDQQPSLDSFPKDSGRRSQTKMAVGSFEFSSCLRYSRADYLRKLVRLSQFSNMQFIHRSVGEPAEGSLTRYPYVNQSRICFHPPFTENERGLQRCWKGLLRWSASALLLLFDRNVLCDAVSFVGGSISSGALLSCRVGREPYFTYFTFFASWLFSMCSFLRQSFGSHVYLFER